jgi:pilus assembly protein CpaD
MSSTLARFLAIAIAGTGLAACTPTASLWSEADAHREIGVERVSFTYDVVFAPGNAQLSPVEAARLSDFLARQQVGYGDRVEIQVPTEDPRLAERRAAAVADVLARDGIEAARGAAHAPGGIRLAVSRNVAVPPTCSDWRKADDDGDPSNTAMPNLGCANLRNLGLMVADPGELVAGHPLSAGSGEPLAAGVERYRTGKTTPLLDWDTTK